MNQLTSTTTQAPRKPHIFQNGNGGVHVKFKSEEPLKTVLLCRDLHKIQKRLNFEPEFELGCVWFDCTTDIGLLFARSSEVLTLFLDIEEVKNLLGASLILEGAEKPQ